MICSPCKQQIRCDNHLLTESIDPLLMNAFNTVNLAGACLLTSTEFAKEMGIPQAKWIYMLGGAGTKDSVECECPLIKTQ